MDETCLDGSCVPDPAPTGNVIHVENPGEGHDIRPHLEAAWEQASTNDTIQLPAGNFIYSTADHYYQSTLFLTSPKPGIHIKGQGDGPGGTRLYRTVETPEHMFSINDGGSGAPIEISDIWFQAMKTKLSEDDTGTNYTRFRGLEVGGDFYIHDCTFQYFSNRALGVSHPPDRGRGVISNNNFAHNLAYNTDRHTHDLSLGYGIGVSPTSEPDSWMPVTPGTKDFVYIEDNYFARMRPAVASGLGSLWVFRHNYGELNSDESSFLDMHPSYTPWNNPNYPYASRYAEAYGNTFVDLPEDDPMNQGYGYGAISFRGGESLIFNNTFKGFDDYVVSLGIGDGWYDESSAPSDYELTYPAPYQIGYGSGLAYGPGHLGVDPSSYGDGDAFIWGNLNDAPNLLTVESPVPWEGQQFEIMNEGRDYHVGVEKPGYTPYTYPHPRRGQ